MMSVDMCYSEKEKLYVSLPPLGPELEPEEKEARAKSLPYRNGIGEAKPARHELESRTIRSRLDYGPAQVLQVQYGFPRVVVARALRLHFEKFNDDFQQFTEFYKACTDVATSVGIRPPSFGSRVTIPKESKTLLARLKDDGTIIGEETFNISYTEYPSDYPKIIPNQCGNCRRRKSEYTVVPCLHKVLCAFCAAQSPVNTCPQCNGSIENVFRAL